MFTAFKMSDGSSVSGISFVGFDAAFDVTETKGVRISDVNVEGRTAVKGSRFKGLVVTDLTHSYRPCPTNLSFAIRSAIYGNV